jgi:N-acetylmuramoyl-L-alanine amidase
VKRRLIWAALAVAAMFHWMSVAADAHAASPRKAGAHAARHHSAKSHATHPRRASAARTKRHATKAASRPRHAKATPRHTAKHTASRHTAKHTASRHTAKRTASRHVATRHAAKSHRHHVAAADKPMIVIDPGHGGRDPGAIGRSGTLEKNVTLKTALELKRQLLATGKYRVALTRANDKFVSLAGRVAFARKHDADLFIAIHADSSKNHNAHGASVYTRTDDSGGTRTARVAATPGNSPAIASTIAKSDPAPPLGSASLQDTMIDNLQGDIRMVVEPSRQAKFYVLRARRIPSVLLEMGFLSNRRDEALLKRAKHRSVIARSLRDAINDYFAHLQRT